MDSYNFYVYFISATIRAVKLKRENLGFSVIYEYILKIDNVHTEM